MRVFRLVSLVCLVALLAANAVSFAQDTNQRYENQDLGFAFDLPTGWEVAVQGDNLYAAATVDLPTMQAGGVPTGLGLRLTFGSFTNLGITDASQMPNLLTRLVPAGVTPAPAEQVVWGTSGYAVVAAEPNNNLTTKIGILMIPGGRVAIVRAVAPTAAWDSGAGAQFDALAQSFEFTVPTRDEGLLDQLISNDGGVFWHYQAEQPNDRVVRAGGITYDMYGGMYMAAGPGGVLALDIEAGTEINYMGPWYEGSDYTDVAISPNQQLYLTNATGAEDNRAVVMVDRAGNFGRGWGSRGDEDGQFAPNMPQTLAVTAGGDIWTVSEGHATGARNRLYKFDKFGNLLLSIDLDTINPNLARISIDNNMTTGALYIVGETGNINVVDGDGQALVVNLAEEILVGLTPIDIAIAPNDDIILALPAPGLNNFGFLDFSTGGRLLDVFGLPYDTARGGAFLPGEYLTPAGIVFGLDGTGYWAETNPTTGYTQVQAFQFSGDGRLPLGGQAAAGPDIVPIDPANGGGEISYGETVSGTLNNRYSYHDWTFQGTSGDHIIITMVDATGLEQLDPKVTLLNINGRDIAANDDVGDVRPEGVGRRDAVLDFYLPDTAQYTIRAGRFGGRGDYTLTLELVQ
jgi:hypothetical protein